MPTGHVFIGTTWEEIEELWAYDGGDWRQIVEGWVYDGTDSTTGWRKFWAGGIPPSFSGTTRLVRPRVGGACSGDACTACVYWTIVDGQSGDYLDVARSVAGQSYFTFGDDVAYDVDEALCTDYSYTGDAREAPTAGCYRTDYTLIMRLTLFRSAVQWDEVFTGTLTACNQESP